jgi:negative regulator of flagellin synthesis FlgM
MSTIDTRSPFFPKGRDTGGIESSKTGQSPSVGQAPSSDVSSKIAGRTSGDAKVSIPDGVKDFARIKKAAAAAPEQDNSEKIARLKAQIQGGTYQIDYDGVADKMLQSEF